MRASKPGLCWILDDCTLSRRLVAARFTQAAQCVETFADARALLARLTQPAEHAFLLITDEQMPSSRGQDLLEAAGALGFGGVRILMSASPELIAPTRFADFIVAKPLTGETVKMLVASAVARVAA